MKRFLRTLILAATFGCGAAFASPVDINTADAAALEQIKGIGPAKAQAIIDYRTQNGPFANTADLVKVPGIGAKTVEQIGDQVTVGASPRRAATTTARPAKPQ